ncbi:Smg-4/UPF3 family-domain-containing protein [Chiua virens]|nr:Smg-4/UPF3 family-domain-containing protein [Chiua virens]
MSDTKQPRKQKPKEPKSQPVPNGAERLKTVVRRLPPNLPEEIFWQSVQAWVSDDTVSWKVYYPGKMRTKRVDKEGIPSRAYIAFKNADQVATFSREYDGHLFRDKAGNESYVVVEFAPFQKVPSEKRKADARTNTIDKDDDYLSFLETLKNAGKAESVTLEALIAASQPPPPPTTTPLLEALKAEKSAQKDKEAILRNHAHYKEVMVSNTASKKEEAKKKAAAAVAPQPTGKHAEAQAPPSVSSSKRTKKATALAVTAQKTPPAQGQGQVRDAGQTGKNLPASGGAPPSTAKSPTPASTGGHGSRNRPPKESHGRSHPAKGEAGATATATAASSKAGLGAAAPISADKDNPGASSAGASTGPPSQRKARPVIGLGRQLEAALNGAGVAVSPGPGAGAGSDRKRRDKDKGRDKTSGDGAGVTQGGSSRRKHREELRVQDGSGSGSGVVPSILHRPEVGGGPDVVIMQRPQSPRTEGEGGTVSRAATETVPVGGGSSRGGPRRGRGRGRGGHRGG